MLAAVAGGGGGSIDPLSGVTGDGSIEMGVVVRMKETTNNFYM
jgi:hypothetical protein